MKTVDVSGVSVSFSRLRALDDVTLRIEAGQVSMLVGPNGAGKSTLIKVLLGLVRPDRGGIEADGQRVPIDHHWKERVGYLPESIAFPENLSGSQVLRFFARARGVSRGRVSEVLDRVGLAESAGRRVRGYSRGMKQRLGLGVSILAQPTILILDEPSSGLDQQGLAVLWSVLREWRDAGRLVLVSSHDLALMERRIDALCVLRSGRVLAKGTKGDLRDAAGLPHRVYFDVAGADEGGIGRFRDALSQWGRGRIEREETELCVEVPPDSVLEIMQIQGRFSDVVRGLRVEGPTLDIRL